MGDYKYRVSRSYDYNALCDVCQFKYKASELRKRWDGLMCCPEDWEYRHPLDFFRTRNDTHKLPFTRSNDGASDTRPWSASFFSGFTYVLATGETADSLTGSYFLDGLQGKTRAIVTQRWLNINGDPAAIPLTKSTSASAVLNLPTTPSGIGTVGTATVLTSDGKLLGTANISGGSTTVTLPSWTSKQGHITFSLLYKT